LPLSLDTAGFAYYTNFVMENIVDDIAITLAYSFVIISCETIDIDEI
jgi:hypothetical protein